MVGTRGQDSKKRQKPPLPTNKGKKKAKKVPAKTVAAAKAATAVDVAKESGPTKVKVEALLPKRRLWTEEEDSLQGICQHIN